MRTVANSKGYTSASDMAPASPPDTAFTARVAHAPLSLTLNTQASVECSRGSCWSGLCKSSQLTKASLLDAPSVCHPPVLSFLACLFSTPDHLQIASYLGSRASRRASFKVKLMATLGTCLKRYGVLPRHRPATPCSCSSRAKEWAKLYLWTLPEGGVRRDRGRMERGAWG